MSLIGIALIVIGIYLAIKVAGFVFKLAVILGVLLVAYWLLAPSLGLPLP
jgi:hypothetical protein